MIEHDECLFTFKFLTVVKLFEGNSFISRSATPAFMASFGAFENLVTCIVDE